MSGSPNASRRLFAASLACGILSTLAPAQQLPGAETIRWADDLDAARQTAASRHAPLLAVFRCER